MNIYIALILLVALLLILASIFNWDIFFTGLHFWLTEETLGKETARKYVRVCYFLTGAGLWVIIIIKGILGLL